MVNEQNWNFTGYSQDDLKAFISYGAAENDQGEFVEYYFLNIVDNEQKDLAQLSFPQLSEAINQINQRYGDWSFYDLAKKSQQSGGCSSCGAH